MIDALKHGKLHNSIAMRVLQTATIPIKNSADSRTRRKETIPPIFDLRRSNDAGQSAASIQAEAIVLKYMWVGISRHHAVLRGRRMAMNNHQAAESTAPRQEGFLYPRPMISTEDVPRQSQGCRRIKRRVNAAVDENYVAEPYILFQIFQSFHHNVTSSVEN